MLSGIKPTGRPHIGNYFGAMRQMVELQDKGYEVFCMIANMHALTTVHDKEKLKQDTYDLVLDYLAIGLDPKKVTIFLQSEVPAHAELTWVFNCITTMNHLSQGHAFKDATSGNKEISVGVFDYPLLMAADILLYKANKVPVGQDQKQHIEYAREAGSKFNRLFGETFVIPEGYILGEVAIIPGVDGRKMSKSYDNTIPLFAKDEEIRKQVMSIVTDSGSELPANVYNIHKLFRSEEELQKIYTENKGKYKILKESLLEDVIKFIKPLRERREEIAKDKNLVKEVIEAGNKIAQERTNKFIEEIKEKVGFKI